MTTSSFSSAYRSPAGTINVTAPYSRLGGQGLKVGSFFGVAVKDVTSGDEVPAIPEGLFILAKNPVGTAMTQGQKLFWDDTNKRLDTIASVGMFVGVCAVAAGATDTTVAVYLDPCPLLLPQATIAALTFGTNIAAATANGSLTDSSATNPTDAQFNELAKELGTKVNAIIAALQAAGIIL